VPSLLYTASATTIASHAGQVPMAVAPARYRTCLSGQDGERPAAGSVGRRHRCSRRP
jgi:hypothetical protein